MAKLARAVIIRDPNRHRDLVFQPGDEPAPEHAALIRNPDCWEGGKLPAAVKRAQDADSAGDGPSDSSGGGDTPAGTGDEQAAPAARKTAARKTAASKPARGRDAAGEGDSGE